MPDALVVLATQGQVVVDVEVTVAVAVLVQPDERPLDHEEAPHGLLGLIGHQRVPLPWGLVDERALRGGPRLLEVAPLAADRVGEDLVRVVVPVDQPSLLGPQDVGPSVVARARSTADASRRSGSAARSSARRRSVRTGGRPPAAHQASAGSRSASGPARTRGPVPQTWSVLSSMLARHPTAGAPAHRESRAWRLSSSGRLVDPDGHLVAQAETRRDGSGRGS